MVTESINKLNKRISIMLLVLFGMIFAYGVGTAGGLLRASLYGLTGAVIFTAGLYYGYWTAYGFAGFYGVNRGSLHKGKSRLDMPVSCFRRMMQTYFLFTAIFSYLAMTVYMFMYLKLIPVTALMGIYIFGGFFYGTVFSVELFLFFGSAGLLLKALRSAAGKVSS